VAYLLQRGADATVALLATGWTPLFYAATRSSPEIAARLVDAVEAAAGSHQAAVDYVNHRDESGATVLDIAVAGEFSDAADVLLEYRPDFLAFTMLYEPDSPVLQNMLGHVCYMADPLL
jgi:ankyrin repeat protein